MITLVALSILGVLILLEGILRKDAWYLPTAITGLLITLVLTLSTWNLNVHYHNEMLIFDNFAVAFSALLIFVTLLIFLFAGIYYVKVQRSLDDIFAILVFALVGCIMMTAFGNLIILFIGIETLSISLYVLAGSHKEAVTSNEATLKYFLLGSFLSCFLLFGIVLVYASSGSFNLAAIAHFTEANANHLSPLFLTGLFFIIIGMAFKIAIVPFHFWAPDVYEGSPTLLTSFMATVVKTASIVALYRIFLYCFPAIHGTWESLLWILAVLTITIGNFTGLFQPNLKRMLAYSSISHSGYMMLAIIAFSARSAHVLLYYSAAYSIATVTAFGILIAIRGSRGNDQFSSFEGMAKTNPVESVCLTVALLSLIGIPPLAGFMGKYLLFLGAIEKGFLGLVIIAIIGSAVSVGYYFRPITGIYLKEGSGEKIETTRFFRTTVIVLTLVTGVLGILPFVFPGLL
jgi:NADH-quinone oxidoreductase subunit N